MTTDAGPYGIEGVRMPSWIIKFDDGGACVSPQTRQALLDAVRRAEGPTHIIFMSHGWNSDFAHAIGQYKAFLVNFEQVTAARPPAAPYRPLFVGVSWPSVWFPIDRGPRLADAEQFHIEATARDNVVAAVAEKLDDPDAQNRLSALLTKDRLTEEDAKKVAEIVLPALTGAPDSDLAIDRGPLTAADILEAIKKMQRAEAPAPVSNRPGTFRPGGDRAEVAGALDYLDPRNLVRLFSVYMMKDRAGRVGATGVSALLIDLLNAVPIPVHLVGHSFGAKVMLSALCAQGLPRPAVSALLLQPAISYLSFASQLPGLDQPGGYVAALGADRVVKPIFSTFSRSDFPLHGVFHWMLRRAGDEGDVQIAADDPPNIYAALGGYGPRGANETLIDPIRKPGDVYPNVQCRIMGLNGSAAADLPGLSGQARIACHGCVANPYTAWALHQQMF